MIDGKKIAEKMLEALKSEAQFLNQKNKRPIRLVAVCVGVNQSVKKFLEIKKKAVERIGIDFRLYEFDETITTAKLRKELAMIVKASVNNGILIELPLPEHLNTQYILNSIPVERDVDVLSQRAQGAFFVGRSPILPPAVEALKQILFSVIPSQTEPGQADKILDDFLKKQTIVIFGFGLLVGKPIAHWLTGKQATVTIIQEFTKNPDKYSLEADIIISAVGRPNLITGDMVKDDAIVIDFGFNNYTDKIVGDVDFESVLKKTEMITPVPGGVGPVVVASVLKNLIVLNKLSL